MEECSDVLANSAIYDLSLDLANQRAALLEFYYSTNGPQWTNQLVSDSQISDYTQLVDGVVDAGYALADGSQSASSSFPAIYTNGPELEDLSINCTIQEVLNFGRFSYTQQWGSNVSYCLWTGVVCCQTVVCSVAAISLLLLHHLAPLHPWPTMGSCLSRCQMASSETLLVLHNV